MDEEVSGGRTSAAGGASGSPSGRAAAGAYRLKDAAQLGGLEKCVGQLVAVQRAPADSPWAPTSTDWMQLVPLESGGRGYTR